MNFLYRFFYGRNGVDQLSIACLIFGLVLTIVSQFIPVDALRAVFHMLNYILLVMVIYRSISRNIEKRRMENRRFLEAAYQVKGWLRLRLRILRDSKDYKYLRCPRCAQRLRVPRGKGRIRVNCSKCQERFEVRV